MIIAKPAEARKLMDRSEKLLEGFLDEHLFTHAGWEVTIDEIGDEYGGFIAATIVYPAQGPTPGMRNLAGFWDVDTVYVLGRRPGLHLILWNKAKHPLRLDLHFLQGK